MAPRPCRRSGWRAAVAGQALLALLLAGCGQKGALVLPTPATASAAAPSSAPLPANPR